MKTFDLNNYGVAEMNEQEMLMAEGGRNIFHTIGDICNAIGDIVDAIF